MNTEPQERINIAAVGCFFAIVVLILATSFLLFALGLHLLGVG